MARQPGSLDGDEVKRQFESFFERAVEAIGEVKDVVVRTSQVGKIKLDASFLRRERDKLLLELGEAVFDRIDEGRLELPEGLGELVARVKELESKLARQEDEIAHVRAEAEERRETDAAVRGRDEVAATRGEDDPDELLDDEDDRDDESEAEEAASEEPARPARKPTKGPAKKVRREDDEP